MEENKSSKGLIITIIVLIVLLLGALGYIAYDKIYQKEEPKVVEEKEVLVQGNMFNLKDVICEEGATTETCTRTVKLSYNKKNHDVVVKTIGAKDAEEPESYIYKYEVYIDDSLVSTLDGGFILSSDQSDMSFNEEGLSPVLYVFNDKYLGMQYNIQTPGVSDMKVVFFDDSKQLEESIPCSGSGPECSINMENKDFDGSNLYFHYVDCSSLEQNQIKEGDSINLVGVAYSFDDNGKLNTKHDGWVGDEFLGGGKAPHQCYNTKTNQFEDVK